MNAGRRIIAMVIGLAVPVGLMTGCGTGTSRSCDEQAALAATLAGDDVFRKMSTAARSAETYSTYPCKENSGGSVVTAGQQYVLDPPLSFEGLRQLSAQVTDPARWRTIAEISSDDPGSGGRVHVCYRSTTGEEPRYLTFHTGEPATAGPSAAATATPTFSLLLVEVSQADEEIEMCPTAG
jgi:hypothetical protein